MSLDLTPVHRNLHTKVTFLGLEFEDLILVLALAALMNIFGHFVTGNAKVLGMPLSLFMEFVVPLLAVPFLILFKYGNLRTRSGLCRVRSTTGSQPHIPVSGPIADGGSPDVLGFR